MPLIEELPTTNVVRPSHGWAYVPDTGRPILAVQPGNRKRGGARESTFGRGDITAKQRKVIQQKLNDLDKENYKDTVIPIPSRPKDRNKKITTNVRRILTYQRTFKHYLEDESAQHAHGAGAMAPSAILPKADSRRKDSTASSTPRRTSTQQLPMHPPPRPQSASATPRTPAQLKQDTKKATNKQPFPSPSNSTPSHPEIAVAAPSTFGNAPLESSLDSEPLLKSSDVPKKPSTRLMEALVNEPPLSYRAAEAGEMESAAPPRFFCSLCGYWGRVMCRKCGDRTCGLMECWRAHEASCVAY